MMTREKKMGRPTCWAAATIADSCALPFAPGPAAAKCRCAFSTITIEASTRTPMASASPPSDMMLEETRRRTIGKKEMTIATGSTVIGTREERKWKRKTMMTSATTIISSINVWRSVSIARWISSLRS